MYIDEDGDTAHEFYVEVSDGSKATLKQINKNLTPQVSITIKTEIWIKCISVWTCLFCLRMCEKNNRLFTSMNIINISH